VKIVKESKNSGHKKEWKSEKNIVKTVKEPPPQIMCHEIEPNLSKDISMDEGDNLSF
jgi:hypothetical protein